MDPNISTEPIQAEVPRQQPLSSKKSNKKIAFWIFAILLFLIAFIAGGFLTGAKTGNPIVQNQNLAPNASVDTFIQNYYNSYLGCINNHFNNVENKNNYNKTPEQDCPYDVSAFTPTLYSQLQSGQVNPGGDPILCAQNTPQLLTFDKANVSPKGSATVIIHTVWGRNSPMNIGVGLQEINDQWKIASIVCEK